jgi:hypothetical protein
MGDGLFSDAADRIELLSAALNEARRLAIRMSKTTGVEWQQALEDLVEHLMSGPMP